MSCGHLCVIYETTVFMVLTKVYTVCVCLCICVLGVQYVCVYACMFVCVCACSTLTTIQMATGYGARVLGFDYTHTVLV